MGRDTTVGFYGKLPALGDFVTRRLPRDFVAGWDEWLQQAIAASREDMGENWLQLYLVSPIWRFALSPGLCGKDAWLGIVIPSVDRVGRYFPLTLASPVDPGVNLFAAVAAHAAWYDAAEQVLLSALDEQDFDLDDFDQRVAALAGQLPDPVLQTESDSLGHGFAWRIPIGISGDPGSGYSLLLHQLTQSRLGAYSLWWTSGSEHVAASLLVCGGLAPARAYGALLNGDWPRGGWEDWRNEDTAVGVSHGSV